MKRITLAVLTLVFFGKNTAQAQDSRTITTAVPFLTIAGDARAAGMGDIGIATSSDAFSQQYNPAKFAFSKSEQGVGVSYTPYLRQLVNDIFLGQVTYYNRINEKSAFAGSFRIFSLGEIEFRDTPDQTPLPVKPNEFVFDATYALKLSEQFSMGVTARYIRSDLRLQTDNNDASAANTFAVDVSGYYQGEEEAYDNFNGRWRGGFNISNIGPKIKYGGDAGENFIPTNLGIGAGFDFILDEFNTVGVFAEVNKLLVPTPPIREVGDEDGDGVPREIVSGQDNNVGFVSGVFQSFGDAPGGFSEELREFRWALGAEYWYDDVFALRTGFFHEAEDKGARQFLSLGAGFKYTTIDIDVSYLFSTSPIQSPLEGTLRFSLTFSFGDTYDDY